MRVSIVIRSYNEAEHIGRLLLGIGQQTRPPEEVIVVDSGSTDGTPDIARSHGAQVVEIDKREFSFGRALNIGYSKASGDILISASAHVYPTYRTWLENLVKPFEDERVVLAYGKQRGNQHNKFSEHQIFARWFPEESVMPQSHYFCNNANCAVRRSAWLAQPYDETLTGLEDIDWAKTVQADGGWIAYSADASVVHVHDESWEAVRNRYRREAIALKRIQDAARFTVFDFFRFLSTNIAADVYSAARKRRFTKELNSIILFRFNQFLGTYKGFNGPEEVSVELRRRFYFANRTVSALADPVPEIESAIDYEALEAKTARYHPPPRQEHAASKQAPPFG